MKKTYINPSIKVYNIEAKAMMAASNISIPLGGAFSGIGEADVKGMTIDFGDDTEGVENSIW